MIRPQQFYFHKAKELDRIFLLELVKKFEELVHSYYIY